MLKTTASALLVVIAVTLSGIPGHAGPPPGREWVPFPAMTDEFSGDGLDKEKWYDHNPTWRGRRPVMFHRDCVDVSDGLLRVSAKNSTLVSCFWLTHGHDGEWSEIDVVEITAGIEKYERMIQPNLHYFHGPHYQGTVHDHLTDHSSHPLTFKPADDFHVYGVEWTPTHIRWYVDGNQIRETGNTHHFQPLELNMNVEANQYLDALPDDNRLPAVYEIDWVRAWRPAGF